MGTFVMSIMDTSLQQRNWRFLHEGDTALSSLSSYAIRQAIKSALPGCPDQELAVRTSRQSVLASPTSIPANDWMRERERDLMGVMAEIAGEVIPLRNEFADMMAKPSETTLYTLPELVVAKKSGWEAWREDELDETRQEAITSIIQNGLREALGRWNMELPDDLLRAIRVIDFGKPMPLVKGDGPRSMARLHVRFIAPFAMDGNLFIGGFPMLGHGKVLRGGLVHG